LPNIRVFALQIPRFSGIFEWSLLMSAKFLLAIVLSVLTMCAKAFTETPVTDPIADYLAMNVPDRVTNAGRLLIIKKVQVDLEGTGKDDVFVGTWYRNSGPDVWLWTGYGPVAGGYKRITPADRDVLIDFDGIYVGYLPEVGRPGMAQAYSLELTNKDRDQSNMISDLTLYYVQDGKLIEQGTGPLDRDDPDQNARFEYFFGPNRKVTANPKVESFTVFELAHRGYHIPIWHAGPPPGTN
jgi:hypothetical protein